MLCFFMKMQRNLYEDHFIFRKYKFCSYFVDIAKIVPLHTSDLCQTFTHTKATTIYAKCGGSLTYINSIIVEKPPREYFNSNSTILL